MALFPFFHINEGDVTERMAERIATITANPATLRLLAFYIVQQIYGIAKEHDCIFQFNNAQYTKLCNCLCLKIVKISEEFLILILHVSAIVIS